MEGGKGKIIGISSVCWDLCWMLFCTLTVSSSRKKEKGLTEVPLNNWKGQLTINGGQPYEAKPSCIKVPRVLSLGAFTSQDTKRPCQQIPFICSFC